MSLFLRPPAHETFVASALKVLCADPRVIGIAAAGSWAEGRLDAFSDLDLVVAVEPAQFEDVLQTRCEIAARLGPLVASFTGEHVGEPRLLICLYDEPLLHVDLKFVTPEAVGPIVGNVEMLWARDGRFEPMLKAAAGQQVPAPRAQWIEDRFWVWIHYAATKVARGELFEALDFLSFLRATALVPLLRRHAGIEGLGVRRIEQQAPEAMSALAQTVATHDAGSCLEALKACVRVYLQWRPSDVMRSDAAERATTVYLDSLQAFPTDRK